MANDLETAGLESPLPIFRRYVTDFVNRHDFSVLPDIMCESYALETSGHSIRGRDGAYASAVRHQMEQFPGLGFVVHDLLVSGNRIGVRFTEHGATAGEKRQAAWPSIAIYEAKGGYLAKCTIEQDYLSRREQLQSGFPVVIAPPAIAPWDEQSLQPDIAAEEAVRKWLASSAGFHTANVWVDDARPELADRIIEGGTLEIDEIMSGGGRVVFHARQEGSLAADFANLVGVASGQDVFIHLSGLVIVSDDLTISGHIIRDRWGLFRRLRAAAAG